MPSEPERTAVPSDSSEANLDDKKSAFLLELKSNSDINLNNLDVEVAKKLASLVREGEYDDVFDAIKEKLGDLDFRNLGENISKIIMICLMNNNAAVEGLVTILKKKISDLNFIELSKIEGVILTLLRTGHIDEIAEIIIPKFSEFKFIESENGMSEILSDLIHGGKSSEVFTILKPVLALIDINNLNFETVEVLKLLIRNGQSKEVFLVLKDKIADLDLSRVNEHNRSVLTTLFNHGHAIEVFELIQSSLVFLDLENITSSMVTAIATLTSYVPVTTIFSQISSQIGDLDFNNLGHAEGILQALMSSQDDEVFDAIKSNLGKVDLSILSENTARIILSLIYLGKIDELRTLIPITRELLAKVDLSLFGENATKALASLLEGNEDESLLEEVVGLERTEFTFDELIKSKKEDPYIWDNWPTVDEQIGRMPIRIDEGKKLKSGWYSYELHKDGGTAVVYVRRGDEISKDDEGPDKAKYKSQVLPQGSTVIIKNRGISHASIDALKKAFEVIPEYVPSSSYQELGNGKPKLHVYGDQTLEKRGFTELYAGPDLRNLNIKLLSGQLKDEIIRQKNYILLMLGINGVDHGDDHLGNFNVRFMLEINGEKQVYFDLNEAFEVMQKNKKGTLTPVVTLRDWDSVLS